MDTGRAARFLYAPSETHALAALIALNARGRSALLCFVLVDKHHGPFPISAVSVFSSPRLVPIRRPDFRGFLSVRAARDLMIVVQSQPVEMAQMEGVGSGMAG